MTQMEFPSEGMMPDQFTAIAECLSGLAEKLNVLAVLLIDGMGRVLAEKTIQATAVPNSETLGALATGSFAASREMAKTIGETDFQMVLLEGKDRSTYITAVTDDAFLVVVFSTKTALGMVRLFTRRSVEQIRTVLARREKRPEPQFITPQFQSLLDDRLDSVFNETM